MMPDDRQLLQRFARDRSEAAFGELVTRYLPLVYSAAGRQTGGDVHAAQDVAQTVFADLARKAPVLSENVILAGWLHRATVFAARQVLRGERRRRAREQQAVTMNTLQRESEGADWQQIRPLLDEALGQLNPADRDALLLRFFEQQSLAQVGTNLGSTEDAARKRVDRALDKLRAILQRRGVTTTAAALGVVITTHAVQAVPAGLAATLIPASLAAAGTGTTLTLLKIMTATQIKLGLSTLVTAGLVTAFVVQHQTQMQLRSENQSLQQQLSQMVNGYNDLSNRLTDAGSDKQLSGDQLNELTRLRGEVGLLRRQTNDVAQLQAAMQNFQDQNRWDTQETAASNEVRQVVMQKIDTAKQGLLALIMYVGDNPGQVPTNFDAANRYINDSKTMASLTNNFVMVSVAPGDGSPKPSETIAVQEIQPSLTFDGHWGKIYGFADGHVEYHVQANSDFTAFEQQHGVVPPASQ